MHRIMPQTEIPVQAKLTVIVDWINQVQIAVILQHRRSVHQQFRQHPPFLRKLLNRIIAPFFNRPLRQLLILWPIILQRCLIVIILCLAPQLFRVQLMWALWIMPVIITLPLYCQPLPHLLVLLVSSVRRNIMLPLPAIRTSPRITYAGLPTTQSRSPLAM